MFLQYFLPLPFPLLLSHVFFKLWDLEFVLLPAPSPPTSPPAGPLPSPLSSLPSSLPPPTFAFPLDPNLSFLGGEGTMVQEGDKLFMTVILENTRGKKSTPRNSLLTSSLFIPAYFQNELVALPIGFTLHEFTVLLPFPLRTSTPEAHPYAVAAFSLPVKSL